MFSLGCPESFLYEGVPFVTNASSPLQGDRVKAARDIDKRSKKDVDTIIEQVCRK